MVMGRPVLKNHDEIIQIGHDFIKWATNNLNALTVPQFATSQGLSSDILREWVKKYPDFSVLYKQGKDQIGINRLRSSHGVSGGEFNLEPTIYKGTLHHYDYDIREDIREEKTFERDLGTSLTDVEPNKDIINQGHENMQLKHELEKTKLEIQQLQERLNANKS